MQSIPSPALPKITDALVTLLGPQRYAADAAQLSFPHGIIPQALDTDLGNGRRLIYTGLDANGTAEYQQPGKRWSYPLTLRVQNADPERAAWAAAQRAAWAAARKADSPAEQLTRELLRAAAPASLHSFYLGMHMKAVFDALAAASEAEQGEALRLALRQLESWLDSRAADSGSASMHQSIEFEAVVSIARELRQMTKG